MTAARGGVAHISSVTRTVPDLATATRFYHDGLGFEPRGATVELSDAERTLLGVDGGRVSRLEMTLGRQHVILLHFGSPGQPYPPASTASDLWFQHCAIVVGDMTRAYEQVMRAGASPISRGGPQLLPPNTGGVTAFKFRDPFGHPWELLGLPDGVGDPLWHRANPSLFLGIDHTAIVVSERDTSLRFYTEVLGLSVAERTRNRGAAQTRLDAVPEDDVDVVALSPGDTPPHLELLAYRTGTRRRLAGSGPADVADSRTLATGNVDALIERLAQYRSHDVRLRHGPWDGSPAVAFQDPDGHAWICRAT